MQQFTIEMSFNVPWKQLIHFNDTSSLHKIENICKLIGLYGEVNFIVRYLMDLFESRLMYRREITLFMNMILSERKLSFKINMRSSLIFILFYSDNGEYKYDIVRDVIDMYLERNVWYLPTSVGQHSTTNIADAQKNVIQICLMTEGLAQMVSSLDITEQNLCLIHCLYPILERVGSEISPISLAGNS